MIIVLKPSATERDIKHLSEKLKSLGLTPHISKGVERTIVGAIGDEAVLRTVPLEAFPGVEKVLPIIKPFKLASREFKQDNTVIKIKNVAIGGNEIVVLGGPCAIENADVLLEIARAVKKAGAQILRGGAFKPRTSPYSFQGLGEEGLKILRRVGDEVGLPVVTEVMDTRDVELVAKYADAFQIGARNMQNFNLLKEVGSCKKPVVLKRGLMSTIKELLMSAEYIMAGGNYEVILCERGIRTFEDATRNTFDVSAIPVIKQLSHLPVIADPSHATGKWGLVEAVALAATAAGTDGLLIEVHPRPEEAFSDGAQSLLPKKFAMLMDSVRKVAGAIGKTL